MWLAIFFITPIIEMYLLIEVGGYIGALPTIGLVMLTAVIGVSLLRIQGLATLTRGMNRLQGGEMPAMEVVEGLLLAVAGALLLTPGFVTDTIGFVLLIPQSRAYFARRVLDRMADRIQVASQGAGSFRAEAGPFGTPFGETSGESDRVIEGDYQPIDPSPDASDRDLDRRRKPPADPPGDA